MKFLFICWFSAMHLIVFSQQSLHSVRVILDTDIGPDYDDVGAVAVLHALADRGEATPLAILASNKNELVAPTINLLNTYFGRPDLPIGAPKGNAANFGAWQKWPQMLLSKYPHLISSTAQVPDAVTIYRKILSLQPDHSVTIVSTGFLTNLSNLLYSKPDRFSPLNGRQLVNKKVIQLVSMAGGFPKGREYNLLIDSVASEHVFNNWPTTVVFSGYEIGKDIKTGLGLVYDTSESGPVKDVFAFCIPKAKEDGAGRMSWDETAVLVAIRGVKPYFGEKRGHIVIHGGFNQWHDDPNGTQYYLTKLMPDEEISAILEKYMKQLKQ